MSILLALNQDELLFFWLWRTHLSLYLVCFFSPELIFKQLGETECLPCIYDKSKADPNACLKKTPIL